MKTLIHIAIIIFIFPIAVEADKIEVLMDGRSLVVRVKDVNANCASKFNDKIEITGKKITITQTDTSTTKQRCECTFDLIHTIGNLSAGKYKIDIFREELKVFGYSEDKKYLVGSTEVEIPNFNQRQGLTFDFRQTPCKNILRAIPVNSSKNLNFEIYPNPGRDEITIKFNTGPNASAKFFVYNFIGKEVFSREFKNLEDGTNISKITLNNLPEGIYIAKLTLDNGISETKKLIWSR